MRTITFFFLRRAPIDGSVLTGPPVGYRQDDTGASILSPCPTWESLPTQPFLPGPLLPPKYTTKDGVKDILVEKDSNRVQAPE